MHLFDAVPIKEQKKNQMNQPPIDPNSEQQETGQPEGATAPDAQPNPLLAPPAAPEAPAALQFTPPALPAPVAPQQPHYAAQPQHFNAPQAPQAPQFAPQQAVQPAQPPLPPQHGEQSSSQPVSPNYGQPAASQSGAPTASQPPYGQPAAPQYGQPGTPQYGAPAAPQPHYGQPAYGAAPAYAAAPVYGTQAQFAAAPPGTVPGPGGYFDGATDPEDLTRPLYGATFTQATKRFFKQYAKFNGRASRSEYWWIALFGLIIEIVPLILYFVGLAIMAVSTSSYNINDPSSPYVSGPNPVGILLFLIGLGLLIIIGLGLLVPSIALTWRRLHDSNFAGPFYFLSFIPSAGVIVLLVLTLLPSKAEGRRFDQLAR